MYAVRSGVHQSRKSPDHTTPVLTFHHARRYSSLILSKVQRQALFQRIPVFLHRQYSDGTSDAGCQVLQLSADIYAGHAGKCAGSLPAALQNCGVCLRLQPHGHIPWQTRARSERNPIIHHQNTSHYGKKSDGT